MASKRIKIIISRYIPETQKSYEQAFEIEAKKGMTVLDALNEIKKKQETTIAYRSSCGMGICGSCGMMINGSPLLACQTHLKDLKSPIKIAPLRHFPVVKDLVADISDVFEKMRGTMPQVRSMQKKSLANGENKQTPSELNKIKQASQCIKCMNCYSACPVYGNDKKFIGPAAGNLAYRYQKDSRDHAKGQRVDKVIGKDGVWDCSFVGECSKVCPKRVDPGKALQRLKVSGALRLAKKLIVKKLQK